MLERPLREKVQSALTEAVDALGDISADRHTEQQKAAYKMCVTVLNEMELRQKNNENSMH